MRPYGLLETYGQRVLRRVQGLAPAETRGWFRKFLTVMSPVSIDPGMIGLDSLRGRFYIVVSLPSQAKT